MATNKHIIILRGAKNRVYSENGIREGMFPGVGGEKGGKSTSDCGRLDRALAPDFEFRGSRRRGE